jgi:hypothetical protein
MGHYEHYHTLNSLLHRLVELKNPQSANDYRLFSSEQKERVLSSLRRSGPDLKRLIFGRLLGVFDDQVSDETVPGLQLQSQLLL